LAYDNDILMQLTEQELAPYCLHHAAYLAALEMPAAVRQEELCGRRAVLWRKGGLHLIHRKARLPKEASLPLRAHG
jgi:hypothetical protein